MQSKAMPMQKIQVTNKKQSLNYAGENKCKTDRQGGSYNKDLAENNETEEHIYRDV